MKFYSHNYEFRNTTAQVMDVFNNMIIKRRRASGDGTINNKNIPVPCVYGPRSRIYKSLENKDGVAVLPMTSISFSGINRDNARAHSVNSSVEFQTGSFNLLHNVAVPVNITYELSIVTTNMNDFNQIITNFVALMNPDIYITWPNPKGQGNIKTQLIWDGSISVEHNEEIGEEEPWKIFGSTTFDVKTWIFPGESLYDDTIEPSILSINFDGGSIPGIAGVINCNGWEPGDLSGSLSGDLSGSVSGCVSGDFPEISQPVVFSRWYDNNKYTLPMDDFMDAIADGNVLDPNYDVGLGSDVSELPIFYLKNIHAILSGEIYNFNNSSDLTTLIENYDSEDLNIIYIKEDGDYLTPESLNYDTIDWLCIWNRMLSGDLQSICQIN